MTHDPLGSLTFIEDYLEEVSRLPGAPEALTRALRYALLGGGKRLRPVLAWECAGAVGGMPEWSLPAGAAVEMVHAFSLVHDDLPAIDNDDMRRGKPSLHRHAGEALAILAGDAMLAGAFELLASVELQAASTPHSPGRAAPRFLSGVAGVMEAAGEPSLRLALIGELVAATTAMIRGQVWDTAGGLPRGLSDVERLRLVHRNKTGALIRAACRMGAMCGYRRNPDLSPGSRPRRSPGADEATDERDRRVAAITAYGEAMGLMFQVVDDLIDATQSPEHAGKATGKDEAAGKLTYPGVMGIEGTRCEVERLRTEALRSVEPLGDAAAGLRELCDRMARRTK